MKRVAKNTSKLTKIFYFALGNWVLVKCAPTHCHPLPPTSIRGAKNSIFLLEITRYYQRLLKITWITRDYQDYPGITKDYQDYQRLPKITRDYQGLPGITKDYQGLLGDYRGLPGITMGLPWDYRGITPKLP